MPIVMHIPHLCMLVFGIAISNATAGTADLVTDRPDQTESSVTVPKSTFQTEAGLTHSNAGDYSVTEAPGILVRYGLSDRLELRLGFEGWIFDEEKDTEGFGDSNIGFKFFLWEQNGWLPESAFMAGVCIPTAKSTFEGQRYDPRLKCACKHTSLRWAGSYNLNDQFGLGYNIGAGWECEKGENGDRHLNAYIPYTVALGIGLTDDLGSFIEFFGDAPVNPGGKPANLIDGGFTYLITDTFQLDISGGIGISDAAEDWFAGCGVSWRYPE